MKFISMSKKLSLNVSEDRYEKLVNLARECGVDLEGFIKALVEGVLLFSDEVLTVKRENPSYGLCEVFSEVFQNAHYGRSLVRGILRELGVERGFMLSDVDFNLKDRYLMLWFDATGDCELFIDSFDITRIKDTVTLTTRTSIDISEQTDKALKKLESIVDDVVDPWSLELFEVKIDKGEDSWDLEVMCGEYEIHVESIPSLKQISEFIKRILRRAGVKYIQQVDST
jgi:hypothetical protein